MENKQTNYNPFSLLMGSTDGFSKPSPAQKTKISSTKLILFDNLLDSNPEEGNSDVYQRESSPSDCESVISGSDEEDEKRVVPVSENNFQEIIKKKFELSMKFCGVDAEVESIKKNHYSDLMSRAKFQSFNLYLEAMKQKRGGDGNLKYAWFGASKTEVQRIFSHRFSLPMNTGEFGQGVYLSPVNHPAESMHSAPADEEGIRHMILCRVILGNMEVVRPGSGQYNPSSEEFDSGVDNLVSPKRYIIWNGDMNTHILPDFVVSFRIRIGDIGRICHPWRLPNSDWMPFATLVKELSKFLPADAIKLVAKDYCEYKKQKLTRHEMIQRLRHVAGDKLLVSILKTSREKMKSLRGCSLHQFNRRN